MKTYCQNCQKVFEPEIKADVQEVTCPNCSASVKLPESPRSPGAVLHDFLLEKELNSGGMGVVYLARQISLDRPVALKVLHQKYADSPEYIEGLFREARAAAKLTHPNIVQAYAVGEDNGIYYFAMEYIKGETFKQILKKTKILEFDLAVKVIREICSALQAAWNEQKLVHQDIKPDNIMLDSNGFAKLADLGLARNANSDTFVDDNETEVMGTPQYISPEQLTGVATDVRSDIYSLGATFYQFVTGEFPYPEESAEAMARKHVEGNLTPPIQINPELPVELSNIIVKMMARNIEERYQMPSEVIADLEAFQERKKSAPKAAPKLQLNLNKKGAPAPSPKQGMPTLLRPQAGAAANPAPLTKPGVPAKPAAPAAAPKPAAPAAAPKPAAPAAAPAKPAAPPAASKPAVPAAPAAAPAKPAAPPAAPAGAPKQARQITVVDEEKKKQEQQTPEAAAPAAEKKEKETEKKSTESKKKPAEEKEKPQEKAETSKEKKEAKPQKRTREKPPKNIGRLLVILLVAVPLLLIAAAITLYILGSKGRLGEKGKKYAEQVSAYVKSKLPAPRPAAAVKQAPVPVVKPAPVTRKEFMTAVNNLVQFSRLNPSDPKFLKDADKFLGSSLMPPVTSQEQEAFREFRNVYDSADEEFRASVYRKKMTAEIEKIFQQRAAEKAAAEKAAAAKEAERLKYEAANKAELEKRKKEDAERLKRSNDAIREINKLFAKLADAFVKAVQGNTPELFSTAVSESFSFMLPSEVNKNAEDAFEDLRRFRENFLKTEMAEFVKFYTLLNSITPENSFPIGSSEMVDVIKLMPRDGKILIRSADRTSTKERRLRRKSDRLAIYRALNAEAKKLFKKSKYEYSGFYYEFIEGSLSDRLKKSNLPQPGWNRYMRHFRDKIKIHKSLL